MSIDYGQAIKDAIEALREGRIQDADHILAHAFGEHRAEQDAAAGLAPEPPKPRPLDVVILDTLREISAVLGHPPRLASLIRELDTTMHI